MGGIAVFLAGAAVAHLFIRWLGLPTTPILLLAGVLLARLDLLPTEILQDTLVLGLAFLVFATGIELDPRRVRTYRRTALTVGALQFVLLGLLGVLAARALGMDLLTALYLGLALTASSTLVVVRLLQRRGQLYEPYGRMAVGVLLLQDLLVVLLIPLLIRAPEGAGSVIRGVLGTLALVGLAWATLRWVTPRIVRLHREDEVLLVAGLTVLFVFVYLADLLALPLAAGAFLAGLALSSFPMRGLMRGQLDSVSDFFAALFFLSLGALLTPPGLTVLWHAAALALLVILVTPVLVTVIAERAGFPARPAIETGLLLSQTSELSLVVVLQGLLLAHITQDIFTTIALVTVFTMVLTPFLTRDRVVRTLMRLHPLSGAPPPATPYRDHVLLLGCGTGGMPLLETLLGSGQQVVVIDDDPEVVDTLRQGDVTCIRGDAADPEVLRSAGAEHAKLISSTIRRPRDNGNLLQSVRGVPVLVRVFEDDDADWVRSAGGIPVLYSEASSEEFVEWYTRQMEDARAGEAEEPGTEPTEGAA